MIGNRVGFNNQLNETNKKFTYFVPRNKAWFDASIEMPSDIKKIFMEDFSYHVSIILLMRTFF